MACGTLHLFERTADGAFAVDPAGRLLFWSTRAEQILGFSSEQAQSMTCYDLLDGKDEAGEPKCLSNCGVLACLKQGQTVPAHDLNVKTVWGCRKWVNTSVILAGTTLAVHLIRDVDMQKRTEVLALAIAERAAQASAPGARSFTPVEPLTARELAVLRLVAVNKSTGGIATELGISTATVRNHLQHIFFKLNCHDRLDAVLQSARSGVITLPGFERGNSVSAGADCEIRRRR